MNVVNSIKYKEEYKLFSINDYNNIIDEDIDEVLSSINMQQNDSFKNILVILLKKAGNKSFDDISSTKIVLDNIPNYEINILHIILNEDTRIKLIIIDILLIIVLFIMYRFNYKIIKSILLGLSVSLLLTLFYLIYISYKFNNEWLYVKKIINNYNLNLITITIICFIIYFVCNFMLSSKDE